jgi:DNA-binding transcriptional LysR family regulator
MLMRQLEYLSALAREGHFGRAAQACYVSQPTLSASIRKLETELGVQVVQRGHRFEGFTPEGKLVLSWAQRILAEQSALRHELAIMRGGLSGVLRIGVIPTASTVAPLLTTPLQAEHPLVRVSIESTSSREIVHRLSEFDLDLGMTYVDGEPLGAVRVVPLYRERYLLLTPSAGDFAGRGPISWVAAASTPLCLLSPVMENRRIIDRNFAEAGVTVTPVVETDTIIAHAWLHMFGVPQGMCLVPLERPQRSYQVGLVLADRDPEPMLARALLDIARLVDMPGELNRAARRHLNNSQPES